MDILAIDDEQDICQIVGALLQEEGYSVGSAANAADAMEIVERERPPLLICDITMPGKNGIQLIGELKARGSMHAVVMLTAHSEGPMVIQALQLGAVDYVVKPFRSEELVSKVPGWLEIGRRLQEIGSQESSGRVRQQLRMIELFRLKVKKGVAKADV